MSSIGKKIMVIGSPGIGKSTFAKKLAEKLVSNLFIWIRNIGITDGLRHQEKSG